VPQLWLAGKRRDKSMRNSYLALTGLGVNCMPMAQADGPGWSISPLGVGTVAAVGAYSDKKRDRRGPSEIDATSIRSDHPVAPRHPSSSEEGSFCTPLLISVARYAPGWILAVAKVGACSDTGSDHGRRS
jgi:hypothetical protein